MAGKYDKNIAKYEARPTDVARLQPLLEAKVDEPGVEPGEVEQEEGGNVAMKKGGTCPAILFQLLSTSARGTGQDNEEEELSD